MREWSIGPNEAGQRLDKFLKKLLPGAPLSLIYKLGRTGKVKVDGKRREDSYRLEEGESVRVFLPDEAFEEMLRESVPSAPDLRTERAFDPSRIVFEDADVLAVSKPAGLNVHPGNHKTDESSLIESVSDYLGGRYDTLTFRPSLVHRIDRDTSGVVLIAKTKRALDAMLSALRNGGIEKTYLAVTVGTPEPAAGTVRKRLLRQETGKRSEKVVTDPAGLSAVTHYRVVGKGVPDKYAVVECRIETGRTHQIRVHLASLGTPVLGDASYGNAPENSYARRHLGVARQLLHAWKLSLPHPVTGRPLPLEAPLETDMLRILGAARAETVGAVPSERQERRGSGYRL